MDFQFEDPVFRAWEPESGDGPPATPPESPSLALAGGVGNGKYASTVKIDGMDFPTSMQTPGSISILPQDGGSSRNDGSASRNMFSRLTSSVLSASGGPISLSGQGNSHSQSGSPVVDLKFATSNSDNFPAAEPSEILPNDGSEDPASATASAESGSTAADPDYDCKKPAKAARPKGRGPNAAAKHHATIERDRRNRLNASIDRLRLFFTDSLGPKHLVVERACEHIEELHQYVTQVRQHFQGAQPPSIPMIEETIPAATTPSRKRARTTSGAVACL